MSTLGTRGAVEPLAHLASVMLDNERSSGLFGAVKLLVRFVAVVDLLQEGRVGSFRETAFFIKQRDDTGRSEGTPAELHRDNAGD